MGVAKLLGALASLTCAGLLVGVLAMPAEAQSASQRVGLQRTGPGTFSIDVDGADIRSVCRAIAEFSGRNIVVGKEVRASVSVALQNVGWREALRTILYSCNLDYSEEGGDIIRVDDRTKLATERAEMLVLAARQMENAPLETRIIKLNYANANELQSALMAGMTKRGSILVEKRTNSLIVSDLPANLDAVEKMAISLDSTTPQIEITAKLVDVGASALRDLGVQWNVGRVKGGPKFWNGIDDPNNAGQKILPGGGPIHSDDNTIQVNDEQKTSIGNPANQVTFGIFKSWASIEGQLQMLEENRKANIISNPRITTVDNREAKIVVGQKIPLIVQDVAGNPVSQLQTIGIQLKVTPHLTQDKKIIMDLHPEVSDLSTQSTVQGGIIINTSEADTRVMVDDGQTAVIGGLIRTNESSVRSGVPLLKDVPLLGMLFRSNSTVRQNRELIIFVTPRLTTTAASEDGTR
jgi:type IV pilus assembly protein PilQ